MQRLYVALLSLRSNFMALLKIVRKLPIALQSIEADYWRARPWQERLQALEDIRAEYNSWKYHAESGFQRICTVFKRA